MSAKDKTEQDKPVKQQHSTRHTRTGKDKTRQDSTIQDTAEPDSSVQDKIIRHGTAYDSKGHANMS